MRSWRWSVLEEEEETQGYTEKVAVGKPRRVPSPRNKPTGTLIDLRRTILLCLRWPQSVNDSQNPLILNVEVTGELHINHLHGAHRKCLMLAKNAGVNGWGNWLRDPDHRKPFPGAVGSPERLKASISWYTGHPFVTEQLAYSHLSTSRKCTVVDGNLQFWPISIHFPYFWEIIPNVSWRTPRLPDLGSVANTLKSKMGMWPKAGELKNCSPWPGWSVQVWVQGAIWSSHNQV